MVDKAVRPSAKVQHWVTLRHFWKHMMSPCFAKSSICCVVASKEHNHARSSLIRSDFDMLLVMIVALFQITGVSGFKPVNHQDPENKTVNQHSHDNRKLVGILKWIWFKGNVDKIIKKANSNKLNMRSWFCPPTHTDLTLTQRCLCALKCWPAQ